MSRFLKSLLILEFVALHWTAQPCYSQVGREYDNTPVPKFVSHFPRKNRPAHGFFSLVICTNVGCRKMIGQKRRLHSISFADFTRDVRKNARKGKYKNLKPVKNRTNKIDSIRVPVPIKKDTVVAPSLQVTVNKPVIKSDSLITLSEVLFETNSYKLKSHHITALDSILAFLANHPSLVARISGHTDNVGKENYNLLLSTRRAEVVAEYFIEQGIAADRVIFEGFGSKVPIVPYDTPLNRARNRRVEILIHDKR